MNAEGKITGCVVDGPLSMDIAIDPEAAHHKGAQDRPAAGHADILLFPDIQADGKLTDGGVFVNHERAAARGAEPHAERCVDIPAGMACLLYTSRCV